MRYPENCSAILDVTKPPYCADNTGKTDCTDVLCRALDDLLLREAEGIRASAAAMEAAGTDEKGFAYRGFENRKYLYRGNSEINIIFPEYTPFARVIYFPAGTYLVSDTVTYRIENVRNLFHSKPFYQLARGIHFLGESAENTVIRLKDHAGGFEAGAEKPVIAYIHKTPGDGRSEITNVAQMNTFADLTVDCGEGNPGAIGLRFVSSNSGRIENCGFRSAGSFAAIETVNGSEGVAENITAEGFDYGIVSTDSAPLVWNHIRMKRIRKSGVLAGGRTILTDVRCEGAELLSFAPGYGVCFADDCEVNEEVPTDHNTLMIRKGDSVTARGRTTGIPFPEERRIPFRMPPFPPSPRVDPDEWVSVKAFGAKGDGVSDDTEAIQNAMKSGKPYVLFESGRYFVNGSISVPANVRVVDFLFCDFEAGEAFRQMRGEGLFSVDGDSEDPLFFQHLYAFEQLCGHFRFLRHNCRRELILRDLHTQTAAMYFNTVRGGRVWLDNCACTTGTYCEDAILERRGYPPEYCPVIPFEFHGQTVRGRSVNPERADLEVLNDASELVFYGFKTEGPGTMIRTVNGGKSELCVLNAGIGHTGTKRALIETDGSPVDLYFLRTGGFAPDLLFENVVSEETPTGKRTIHRTDITGNEENEIAHTLTEYHSMPRPAPIS